jgi:tetratricopeptide (TPR) repeat protein
VGGDAHRDLRGDARTRRPAGGDNGAQDGLPRRAPARAAHADRPLRRGRRAARPSQRRGGLRAHAARHLRRRRGAARTVPLPSSPGARDAKLAEAHALFAAGRYTPALALATAVADEARALAFSPLVAEALLVRGELLAATGEHAAAEEVLLDSVAAAVEARHERVLAEGAARLVFLTGYWLGRRADGYRWAKLARAALARLGEPDATRAEVLRAEAIVHGEAGEGEKSYALAEEAVRAGERAFKTNGVRLVQLYATLGAAAHVAHKQPEARRAYERALAIAKKSLGGDHEFVASALSGLGNVALTFTDKNGASALAAQTWTGTGADRAALLHRTVGHAERRHLSRRPPELHRHDRPMHERGSSGGERELPQRRRRQLQRHRQRGLPRPRRDRRAAHADPARRHRRRRTVPRALPGERLRHASAVLL